MTGFVALMPYGSKLYDFWNNMGYKMNFKYYAIGSTAFLMPFSAWAADAPQKQSPAKIPAIVQAANTGIGYYVEGQLGATKIWDVDSNSYSGSVAGITYANLKGTFAYQTALTYGAEAGISNVGGMPIRLGLAYQGFTSKLDKVTGSGTFTYNGTTYNLSQTLTRAQIDTTGLNFDNKVNLFFANAYYDFNTGSAFRPFVGAGIGLANIDHAKNNEMALNASIGAQYDLTSNMYLGAKVQLNWVNGPKDKLGISYNNIMATTGLLSIGVKF